MMIIVYLCISLKVIVILYSNTTDISIYIQLIIEYNMYNYKIIKGVIDI